MVGGLPLLKCALEVQYPCRQMEASRACLCTWKSSSGQSFLIFAASTAKMPQQVRNLIGNFIIFFSLGHKEVKVEREHRVQVFNGFINAWFDYWYKHYDYANMWKWFKEKNFWFFVLPFFPEKAQNKNKAGIKATFILMMKIHKAKSPKQVHFRLGGDERIFFFLKNIKQQTNILIKQMSNRNKHQQRPECS